MEFDWDDRKNAINKSKHKIDFRDVMSTFFDDNAIVELSRFAAEKNYRHWEFPFKYSTIEKVAKNLKTT
jgi:uncharacterized DUF497 family protein